MGTNESHESVSPSFTRIFNVYGVIGAVPNLHTLRTQLLNVRVILSHAELQRHIALNLRVLLKEAI